MTDAGAPAVFAVDGGNSKAEALLVGVDGRILGAARAATVSHQQVGFDRALGRLAALAAGTSAAAGIVAGTAIPGVGVYCLAGADLPADTRRLERSIASLELTATTSVRNDTRAALRAGATRPWGIALICGQGVNGVGVGPTGRTAGFDALGEISGDWGGGTSVGEAGLAAAVRASDGRGPGTALRDAVPAFFGVRSIAAVVHGLYRGAIGRERIAELAPLVFSTASAGDSVATEIVDRLAEELATMALALIRRTGQTRLDPEIVLAGGVLQAGHRHLIDGVMGRIWAVVPGATPRVLAVPPVVGAALLGIDELHVDPGVRAAAERRLRADAEATIRFVPLGTSGGT